MSSYVLPLEELNRADVQRCGGKAAGLGDLIGLGLRVPPGFCVMGHAFSYLIESNSLDERIADVAAGLNFEDYSDVENKTAGIRALIMSAKIPNDVQRELSTRV